MTLSTQEQALLNLLQSDVLTTFGAPLVTLIQSLVANKGNFLAQQASWLQFVAAAPAAGIALGVEFEGQLLNTVLTNLQAHMASTKPA